MAGRRALTKEEYERLSKDEVVPAKIELKGVSDEEAGKQTVTNAADVAWRQNNPRAALATLSQPDPVLQETLAVQKWLLVSYIDPKVYSVLHIGHRKYKGFLLKSRGVFASKADAKLASDILLLQEPEFTIHLVPMFAWTPLMDQIAPSPELDDWLVQETVARYIETNENEKSALQRRIADVAAPITALPKMTGDPEIDQMQLDRADRSAESCDFFFKVQEELENKSKSELPDFPKTSTSGVFFESSALIEHTPEPKEAILAPRETEAGKADAAPLVLSLKADTYQLGTELEYQKWLVFSCIFPSEYRGPLAVDTEEGTEFSGVVLKPRGVFETEQEAERHAEKLSSGDHNMDVHINKMFQWCPLEDDKDVNDRNYTTEWMRSTVAGYNEQRASLNDSLQARKERALRIGAIPESMRSQALMAQPAMQYEENSAAN